MFALRFSSILPTRRQPEPETFRRELCQHVMSKLCAREGANVPMHLCGSHGQKWSADHINHNTLLLDASCLYINLFV